MALTVAKTPLLDLIQKAHSLAPIKSSLQILANLRLTAASNMLRVAATDLDHSIECTAPVTGENEFDIAINARKLYDIAREIPDGQVDISVSDSVLNVVSEHGFSCKVAGADVADFPGFPVIGTNAEFSLPVADFQHLVEKGSFAVSKDTTRSCLCGVLWEITGDRCTMVATDGHRLGKSYVSCSSGLAAKASVIVSPRTLQHVARIAESSDKPGDLTISIAEKYLVLTGAGFRLCSKLIEGPYPDYDKVIPKTNPKTALIDRASLIDAVRRVSVLSNQKTHLVKFAFSRDTLEVKVLNRDIGGEARQTIPVEYRGEDHTIGFNAIYLSEILTIAETPTVRLEMNTQISACLVVPCDRDTGKPIDNDLFLIMPLRLMDEL